MENCHDCKTQKGIDRAAQGSHKTLVKTRDPNQRRPRFEQGGVTLNDPKKIARSLKRSAERSHRRKANPYRSALSVLTFYINRGGKNLSARRRHTLEKAKDELKVLFHRT